MPTHTHAPPSVACGNQQQSAAAAIGQHQSVNGNNINFQQSSSTTDAAATTTTTTTTVRRCSPACHICLVCCCWRRSCFYYWALWVKRRKSTRFASILTTSVCKGTTEEIVGAGHLRQQERVLHFIFDYKINRKIVYERYLLWRRIFLLNLS